MMIKEFLRQLNDRDEGEIELDSILDNDRNKAVYEKWIQVFNVMNPMTILTGLSVVANSMKMTKRDEVILLAYTKFMEQNMKKLVADMPKDMFEPTNKEGVNYDGTMFN
tara:strand:+ start:1001 stop:1327 length:327 start_codon:yes stop_codon:yes gene_type:complete